MKNYQNIFEDEFKNVAFGKKFITLNEIVKINFSDDNNEMKINLIHIRNDVFK